MYKVLWSMVKGDLLKIRDDKSNTEWSFIKNAIVKKVKDMDPKVLTNILILSTVAKDTVHGSSQAADLFDAVEPELIIKLKSMNISELINLLWSAQEIQKGSPYFFGKLEEEICARLRTIKDEDFSLLLECFIEDGKSKFSENFLQMLLKVIVEKKDRFDLKTLVHTIWSLSKLDVDEGTVHDILYEMKDYPRLRENLGNLLQKSQCIMLWTYTKNLRLFDREFIADIGQSIINYKGPKFELDNFDILLIIQSIIHLERNERVNYDHTFMNTFY